MSSFAKQYGIRLRHEDLPVSEYRQLLTGIMADTPLGRVVEIRAETDPKKIKEMTAQEKKIRSDWQDFKRKKGVCQQNQITITVEQLQNMFKSLAR